MNGIFNLTPKEIEVMGEIIQVHLKLKDVGISAFSTEGRKHICKGLEFKNDNMFNLYLQKLVEKKAINKTENDYEIDERLIPTKEVLFRCQKI